MNTRPPQLAMGRTRRAFTLIELLVVIAIIGVLLSLLLSGVSKAKTRAQRTECLGNLRQLTLVWQMHYSENDDKLVSNYRPRSAINSSTPPAWVQGDRHYAYDTVTNSEFLTDPKYAAFAGMVPNPRAYRCPAVRHEIKGVPLIRSFSMNQYMGAVSQSDTEPGCATFNRVHDVSPPVQTFVFLEMNPYTICSSIAYVPMDTKQAKGKFHMPTYLHGGRAAMAYADGHLDSYAMRDKDSLRTYQVDWMQDHDFAMTNADVIAIREQATYPK